MRMDRDLLPKRERDHGLARSVPKQSRNRRNEDSEGSQKRADHQGGLSNSIGEIESEIDDPFRLALSVGQQFEIERLEAVERGRNDILSTDGPTRPSKTCFPHRSGDDCRSQGDVN